MDRRDFVKKTTIAVTAGCGLAACDQLGLSTTKQAEKAVKPQKKAAATPAAPPVIQRREVGTTLKIQTSWQGGVGLDMFRGWCYGIRERTGGELDIKPYGSKDIVGDFKLFDAVEKGLLDGMNAFTLYWSDKIPASVFLASYPLGLRQPHEWEVFFYNLGGIDIAREIFQKFGMYYLGPVRHGANIIHSKVPINSIDDFRGRRMRLPGGLVAEVFQAAGARTFKLPGGEIFKALETNKIDVADYVGPAINYELGFHRVTKYVSMGPPGFMSIYQPVDLMDLTISLKAWNALSSKMKQFLEADIFSYSVQHHTAIESADQKAWQKFKEAGIEVTRLSESDVEKFTQLAVPLWFKWANKDPFAARVFQIQLQYMMSGSLGYVSPSQIEGQTLNI